MNAIDNIERTLEEWGQNLRGETHTAHGMQPRDVLKAVLSSLEKNRVEGLDHKQYAPNQYRVEMRLDPEESSRLAPFTGEAELRAAIERYCHEKKYLLRGPLVVQVMMAQSLPMNQGIEPAAVRRSQADPYAEKVIVHSGFEGAQASDAAGAWSATQPPVYNMPVSDNRVPSEHDLGRRDTTVVTERR